MRLGADEFQINAQEANLRWFEDTAYGLDVTIEEITEDVASLALQGPLSMTLLRDLGLAGIDALAPVPYRALRARRRAADGQPHRFHRRPRLRAVDRAGARRHVVGPADGGGRVQAADRHRLRGARSGAHRGWLHPGQCRVHLGDAYTARQPDALALRTWPRLDGQPREGPLHRQARAPLPRRRRGGPRRRLVGLDIAGKKPAVESFLYAAKTEVGRTTSAIWSPVLKRNIALASVASAYAAEGIELKADIWHTKELKIERIMAPCRVVSRRFYDAPRRCRYTNDQ